jgi:hypothetical protein
MNIVKLAFDALPSIVALIQSEHAKANPGVPPPTDAEVIAALHSAVVSVVAKGEAWKASHPGTDGDVSGPVPAGSTGD